MRSLAAMASSSSRHEAVPRRPFGRHSDLVSILGLGGYHLGKARTVARSGADRSRSDRRRHQLPRQRLGVSRRRERAADGPRDRGSPRLGVPDDQGVHARTRRARSRCASSTNRCGACGPTTSISGRFTSASTTTIPSAISRKAASSRRSSRRKRRARSDTSASPATRIPRSICGCCRSGFRSTPVSCR